jgi:hypothetical protein
LDLPITRVSVDHGTALDLVGTGNIDISSFLEAIKVAKFISNAKVIKKDLASIFCMIKILLIKLLMSIKIKKTDLSLKLVLVKVL